MNIVIRSQNGSVLIIPKMIYIGNATKIYAASFEKEEVEVGRYDSYKQAIWILDRIQEELRKENRSKFIYDMPSVAEVEMRINK